MIFGLVISLGFGLTLRPVRYVWYMLGIAVPIMILQMFIIANNRREIGVYVPELGEAVIGFLINFIVVSGLCFLTYYAGRFLRRKFRPKSETSHGC